MQNLNAMNCPAFEVATILANIHTDAAGVPESSVNSESGRALRFGECHLHMLEAWELHSPKASPHLSSRDPELERPPYAGQQDTLETGFPRLLFHNSCWAMYARTD